MEELKKTLANLDYSEDAIAKRISDAINNASDKSRVKVLGVTPKTLTVAARELLKKSGYEFLFYGGFDEEDSTGCLELFKF